jgi:hypothetical protein
VERIIEFLAWRVQLAELLTVWRGRRQALV